MNTTAKGSAAERYVANWLRKRGWIVGSLRHSKGAGDLLAVDTQGDGLGNGRPAGTVWLIEVKCAKDIWQQFRREDRQTMRETPLPPGGERFCVNVRGKELEWWPESTWP